MDVTGFDSEHSKTRGVCCDDRMSNIVTSYKEQKQKTESHDETMSLTMKKNKQLYNIRAEGNFKIERTICKIELISND